MSCQNASVRNQRANLSPSCSPHTSVSPNPCWIKWSWWGLLRFLTVQVVLGGDGASALEVSTCPWMCPGLQKVSYLLQTVPSALLNSKWSSSQQPGEQAVGMATKCWSWGELVGVDMTFWKWKERLCAESIWSPSSLWHVTCPTLVPLETPGTRADNSG